MTIASVGLSACSTGDPLHLALDLRGAAGGRVVGAAEADRRERDAVGADRPAALRAREAGLPVGMPIAGGHVAVSVPVVMRVHVAFTPEEEASAPLGIVVDVLRATSTIAQALASGYRRVLCCAEIDEARGLREETEGSIVGGERNAVRIEGFDVGASPREFLEPRADTLILSTTNGTRTILAAAGALRGGAARARS